MEEGKKKLNLKGIWKDVVVPAVKEWLPEILKFLFKKWVPVLLATTTVVSTGGFVYEKISYDNLRNAVDSAQSTALSDLDKLKTELLQLTEELESTRRSLEESTGLVERQRETIRDLQDTNRRLTEIYHALEGTGGAIESGERSIADLIERSIKINRELQSDVGKLAKASK